MFQYFTYGFVNQSQANRDEFDLLKKSRHGWLVWLEVKVKWMEL